MVYGELGITPLDINIKVRMIVYWACQYRSELNLAHYLLLIV